MISYKRIPSAKFLLMSPAYYSSNHCPKAMVPRDIQELETKDLLPVAPNVTNVPLVKAGFRAQSCVPM